MSPKRPSLAIHKVCALGSAKKPAQSRVCRTESLQHSFTDMCFPVPRGRTEKPHGASQPRCPAQTPRRLCYPSPF